MKMRQFNYIFINNVCMFKSSYIERNAGRSASYLIAVDAIYSSG